MQGMLGPRWKVVKSVLPQIALWTFFFSKGMILKKMGMSKKSAMKVTFNVYHEIEEI